MNRNEVEDEDEEQEEEEDKTVWAQDPIPRGKIRLYDAVEDLRKFRRAATAFHINRIETEFMENRSGQDIEHSTEKLLQDLKAVVRDGEELLRAGAHELGERGMAARERLAAALEAAKETRRRLEQRAREGFKATDRVVREHPYQSIGVAFGVGLLIGVLVNRK